MHSDLFTFPLWSLPLILCFKITHSHIKYNFFSCTVKSIILTSQFPILFIPVIHLMMVLELYQHKLNPGSVLEMGSHWFSMIKMNKESDEKAQSGFFWEQCNKSGADRRTRDALERNRWLLVPCYKTKYTCEVAASPYKRLDYWKCREKKTQATFFLDYIMCSELLLWHNCVVLWGCASWKRNTCMCVGACVEWGKWRLLLTMLQVFPASN